MTYANNQTTLRMGNLFYPEPSNVFIEPFPLVKCKFENIDTYIPNNADIHLKSRYGDYMQLPPEEERVGHIPYELDFGQY